MDQWRIYVFLLIVGISLVMEGSGQADVQVRLVGGFNEREGRVEVYYNGTWGTICDDDWDIYDAAVVCRMLGYVGLARAYVKAQYFGPGTGKIWMDSVTCSGDESSIAECQQLGWGESDCRHDEDAGVSCLGERIETPTTPVATRKPSTTTAPERICDNPRTDVRLVGGPTLAEGRVQYRREGVWGDICDDRWGLEDARVICRMLCYNPENARAHLGGKYGNATGSFLLDEVQCIGSERTVGDCPHSNWGENDCDLTEAAGVSCNQEDLGLPNVPEPTVTCDSSIIRVEFDRAKEPRLEPKYLTIVEATQTCDYSSSIDINYVTMAIPFIGCGTKREENSTHIIYENSVRHAVPPPSDVLTRSTAYTIPVVCVMPRTGDPENNIQPEARTAKVSRGKGTFDVKMFFYLNNRFVDPIQRFPARVVLGEMVYVAMSLYSSDPNLKLVIPVCWATPEKEADSQPRVDLIVDKCINEESVRFYPINDTTFGFRFTSFKFLGDFPYTYIHCDGYVCGMQEKNPECDRSCGTASARLRQRRQANIFERGFYDVHQGPISFLERSEDAMVEREQLRRRSWERLTPKPARTDPETIEGKPVPISGSRSLHISLVETVISLITILILL